MQPKVKIEGDAIVSLKNLANKFDKSVKNALEIIGYRLKKEMEEDIKNDRMFWAKPTPLTLRMRKKYKRDNAAGVYFAKGAGDEKSFIRYRVDKNENTGYSLRVGVIDPPEGKKAKPLSKSIKVNQQKFAQGFSFAATREFIRKRIKAYIKATRGTEWSKLSKRQKKNVKKELLQYGVVKKVGSIVKAPPRPIEPFLWKRRKWIEEKFYELYKKKLKGEYIPNDWWKRQ